MRLIENSYNQETGITTIVLADKFGKYTGTAKLHPQDVYSKFVGCNIAEARAEIKSLKNRKKYLKVKLKTLKELEKEYLNIGLELNKILINKINYYTKEILKINQTILLIESELYKYIKTREKIINRTKKTNDI